MSDPDLSIIIPYFNSRAGLPALLDSIQAQTFDNLEVIVADGHSEAECGDIVEEYAAKGMDIKLTRAFSRQYTLASRLAGFRISRGRAIFFADSDDYLINEASLAVNVSLLLKTDSDIVNFRTLKVTDSNGSCEISQSEDIGLGGPLRDVQIFKTFLRTKTSYPNLWSKIYSRKLIEKISPLPILNHPGFYGAEDRLLNTVAMYFAKSYIPSEMVGYVYNYTDQKKHQWAIKAIPSYVTMLEELLPFLEKMGADKKDLILLSDKLKQMLTYYMEILSDHYIDNPEIQPTDDVIDEILAYSTPEQMLKGMIVGHPIWKLYYLKKNLRKKG